MSTANDMPTIPKAPNLNDTFGALFIGMILASAFWGIGTTQAFWYYTSYWKKDSRYLKAFVALVWIFDTTNQIMLGHLNYYFLIRNYFNPPALNFYIWSLNFQSFFEAMTCLCVQTFFVRRIWILSNGRYVLIVIPMVCVLARFGLSLAYTIQSASFNSIPIAFAKIHSSTLAIDGVSAGADIVIAATMVHLLYASRSGMRQTNHMIKRLMLYTVNTGLITSICALMTLIMGLSFTQNFLFGTFYFITGKLYFNTMLASLNARNSITGSGSTNTSNFQVPISTVGAGFVDATSKAGETQSTFAAAPNPSKEHF